MLGKSFHGSRCRYCPSGFIDTDTAGGIRLSDWRNECVSVEGIVPICRLGSNNYTKDAKSIREIFRNYFLSTNRTDNVFDNYSKN